MKKVLSFITICALSITLTYNNVNASTNQAIIHGNTITPIYDFIEIEKPMD